MRIIGGALKGKLIKPPKDLPVRPTTDFAKEALFNILANKIDFTETAVLDLFSGSGHISLEFASRGSKRIVSVDENYKCTSFLKSISQDLKVDISVLKEDVFKFLNKCNSNFDLIFADPPYNLAEIPNIHQSILEKKLLSENGILIIEHGAKTDLTSLVGFDQHRKYGNVNFSFFSFKNEINKAI